MKPGSTLCAAGLSHTTREAGLGSRREAVAQNSPTQGGREVFALGNAESGEVSWAPRLRGGRVQLTANRKL
jgi:hypothetical protein